MGDLHGPSAIERVIALRSFPGYATLPLGEVDALARAAEERQVKSGDCLFRAGEPASEVFFVTGGRVGTHIGRQHIRDFLPGSAVGGLAVLGDIAHVYDCVAAEDSTVIVLKASIMTDIFEEHFEIVRTVLGTISGQMRDLRQALGLGGGYAPTEWEPHGPPPPPMNLIERLRVLRSGIQFAGSQLEALADLARECDEVRMEAGDTVWCEGEVSESFVFVVWGVVSAEGADGVQARFGPGDVVGFLGAFSGQPRWYTAKAETPLVGLRLSSEVLLDVCEDHTELALEMVRTTARGLLSVIVNTAGSGQEPSK